MYETVCRRHSAVEYKKKKHGISNPSQFRACLNQTGPKYGLDLPEPLATSLPPSRLEPPLHSPPPPESGRDS
jgi:hypothetical protein